jgi:epsilon-lactone hydrolase
MLRDDAKRCATDAAAAGVDATYIEGEGMVHIWPIFADRLPEARAALEDVAALLDRVSAH